MTLTLPLQPQEEAKLVALAQAKGISPNALVREVVDLILSAVPDPGDKPEPTPLAAGNSSEIRIRSFSGGDRRKPGGSAFQLPRTDF